jgi:hypothetical protein
MQTGPSSTPRPARRGLAALLLLAVLVLPLAACTPERQGVPEVQGHAPVAAEPA